jgi:hypothetical protein
MYKYFDCGDGQTSGRQAKHEEKLSFCMERDVHHHGNCHSGLGIAFLKIERKHTNPPTQENSLMQMSTQPGRGELWILLRPTDSKIIITGSRPKYQK